MTAENLCLFRTYLKSLPSIKAFAKTVNLQPHTLYNYIGGQEPSYKNYKAIIQTLERDYPKIIQ